MTESGDNFNHKQLNTILFGVIGCVMTILLGIIAYNMTQAMELNFENSKAVILINNKADRNKELILEAKVCADKIEGKVEKNTEKITQVEHRTEKVENEVLFLKSLPEYKKTIQ